MKFTIEVSATDLRDVVIKAAFHALVDALAARGRGSVEGGPGAKVTPVAATKVERGAEVVLEAEGELAGMAYRFGGYPGPNAGFGPVQHGVSHGFGPDFPLPDEGAGKVVASSGKVDLPPIPEGERERATDLLREFCWEWTQGFEEGLSWEQAIGPEGELVFDEDTGAPVFQVVPPERKPVQPDRVALLRTLTSSSLIKAIFIMAFEKGSLQRLVEEALQVGFKTRGLTPPHGGEGESWLDYVQRVAASMVAIASVTGFPDLDGTLDYSTAWRKA